MDINAPLFRVLTLQTVLPLTTSDESISIIVGWAERSGYDFTSSVETVTAKDLGSGNRPDAE